jgi:hypothetical protein
VTHPLVEQLRFARAEFVRGLEGVTDEEGRRRFGPMNCISWNVGHMAWQEQRYWLIFGQQRTPLPEVNQLYRYGAAALTPPLGEVREAWQTIVRESDPWLDQVTSEQLLQTVRPDVTYGNLLLRTTYHYWYHCGENQAIRQMLGHTGLPDFVGNIDDEAPYRPV